MQITEYKPGMQIEPGAIISGMPIEIYHGEPCREFISSTGVKNALVSYENYEYHSGKNVFKYAYDFGNVFHTGMESQIKNGDFRKWDDLVLDCPNKTTSKKFLDLKESNPDNLYIHSDDLELIEELVDKSIITASEVNLLENGYCELSMFWIDETTGLKCKCRPDFFREDIGLCVDFKTCQDSSREQFKKDIANFGYHVSAEFYAMGIKATTGININHIDSGGFLFVAVQKAEPNAVNIYQLDDAAVMEGNKKVMYGLVTITEGTQETEITQISLPGWAFSRD